MQYSFHHSSFYLCSILLITPTSIYAIFFSSLQLIPMQHSFHHSSFYSYNFLLRSSKQHHCLLVVKLYLPCPVIAKLGFITTVVALRSLKPFCVRCNLLNLFVHISVISIGHSLQLDNFNRRCVWKRRVVFADMKVAEMCKRCIRWRRFE